MEDQFTTHTYTLRDGKIVYSKGNDHIVDAVRCAMLAREEGNLDPVGEEVGLAQAGASPILCSFKLLVRPRNPTLVWSPCHFGWRMAASPVRSLA